MLQAKILMTQQWKTTKDLLLFQGTTSSLQRVNLWKSINPGICKLKSSRTPLLNSLTTLQTLSMWSSTLKSTWLNRTKVRNLWQPGLQAHQINILIGHLKTTSSQHSSMLNRKLRQRIQTPDLYHWLTRRTNNPIRQHWCSNKTYFSSKWNNYPELKSLCQVNTQQAINSRRRSSKTLIRLWLTSLRKKCKRGMKVLEAGDNYFQMSLKVFPNVMGWHSVRLLAYLWVNSSTLLAPQIWPSLVIQSSWTKACLWRLALISSKPQINKSD